MVRGKQDVKVLGGGRKPIILYQFLPRFSFVVSGYHYLRPSILKNGNYAEVVQVCGGASIACKGRDLHNLTWSEHAGTLTATSYAYDALGRRVEKIYGGSGAGVQNDYAMDGSNPLDTFISGALYRVSGGFFDYTYGYTSFNRTDNIGTPKVTTKYDGTIDREETFGGPFGDNMGGYYWGSFDTIGFAGGDWDSENNGDHFGAREYAKLSGNWQSPDPAGRAAVDLTNPQSWNLYAYALNNPVSANDPSGLLPMSLMAASGSGESGFDGFCDAMYESCADNSFYEEAQQLAGMTAIASRGDFGVSGLSLPCDFGGCGDYFTGPNPSGQGTYDDPYTFYSDVMWPFLPNPNGSGGAANNWWGNFFGNLYSHWSWGVRGANQTYGQCLSQNSSNYSLAGALNQQGGAAQLVAGNDVASLLFGNSSEGLAGSITAEGASQSLQAGAGTALTFGRRTASIFDLNLSGVTGAAPAVLANTGAKAAIATAAAYKFAADVGATIALLGGCLAHP